jgi:DNA mismatch endonuclease (patch repair protein)
MDTMSKIERSRRMSLIRPKDTKPEMLVRRMIFAAGFRYRLHQKSLPGCPDIVFRQLRKVVFVHGCFWHRHPRCKLARLPKSKLNFWKPKLDANRARDLQNTRKIRRSGWKVLTVWECEIKNASRLGRKLIKFLNEG